jgi:hypothetical protein
MGLSAMVCLVVKQMQQDIPKDLRLGVCTENPIRVDDVMESPKLAE